MRARAAPAGGHEIRLLEGGDQLFPALCAAIRAATHEVWFASYIVHTDAPSEAVLHALRAAARRGVRVRVVVDGFGARHALPWWRERLEGSGVALAVFRPIDRWWHWLQPGQLRRLHQKLCAVDGEHAFVGGINLIDDRRDLNHGELEAPRLDYAVHLRGALAHDVARAARKVWTRAWLGRDFSEELRDWLLAPELVDRSRELLGRWWERTRGLLGARKALRAQQRAAQADARPMRAAFVLRDNLRHRHAIEREYLHALRSAQTRFDLICPYFYPSARLLRALLGAARRGVQVRLLLQGRFDYRLAALAARALYAELLARGVRIYEYRAAFLHAKVALADADWATVGSSNLDPTSLLLNLEANVVVYDAGFTTELAQAFERALAGAEAVHPAAAPQGLGAWLKRLLVAWIAQTYLRVAGGPERY